MDKDKYRGKRVDNGEWAEGSLVSFNKNCYIVTSKNGYSYGFTNGKNGKIHIKDAYEVHPDTVGQYIGRLDVADNEIYKDDIMQNCQRESSKGVVVIDEKGYHLKKPHGDGQRYYCGCIWDTENWLVIGTIHDKDK